MSNAFVSAAFKPHFKEMIETHHRATFSKKLFLPSTTDCKESIDQYLENVSLSPVDCLHEDFKELSPSRFNQ